MIGSQSILGSFDEAELPWEATASQEADIAFLDDPAWAKADEVEGAIGEMSTFHEQNGIYAEGVHIDTAILPDGWKNRRGICPPVNIAVPGATPLPGRLVRPVAG